MLAGLTVLQWSASLMLSLAVALLTLAVVGQSAKIIYLQWRYRHIPGPRPNLLLGNMGEVIKLGGFHVAIPYYTKKFGKIFKIFFMQYMFVVVADPDAAPQVLRLPTRPKFLNPAGQLLPARFRKQDAASMLNAKGGLWRMLRNAWQPAFAPASLQQYFQLMDCTAQELVALLNQQGSKHNASSAAGSGDGANSNVQYVDLHELFNSMTLDVVGTCAYGVKFQAMQRLASPPTASSGVQGVGPVLQQAAKDIFAVAPVTTGSKWGIVLSLLPQLRPVIAVLANAFPDQPFKRMCKARAAVMQTSEALIQDWRRHQTIVAHQLHPTGHRRPGVQPGSFLSLLLEAQQKAVLVNSPHQLDDLTITSQCNGFILAGSETTASSLTFAVYFLCQHPDKLDRLLQEVDAHGRDTPTGPDDEFPYVDAVLNEAMRLMPVAPATLRLVEEPAGMQLAGYHIPCGTSLMSATICLHSDPDVWPHAHEFIPERWLPEGQAELGARSPNAFTAFGGGPRMCIGWKFALQEARIALVQVYKRFTFKLQPGQVPLPLATGMTLAPKHGLLAQPIPRAGAKL